MSSLDTSPAPSQGSSRDVFKKMFTGSTWYMVGIVGQRLLSLLLVPIVTRYLAPADYGVLDLLEQIGVVLSLLLGLNFSSALGYFYFAEGADRSRVVGTTLAGSLMIGTFAGLIGFIFADPLSALVFHSPGYGAYVRVVFAFMPLAFLLEAGLGWLRTEDRVPLYTNLVILRLVVILAGTLTLVMGFHLKVWGVLLANNAAIVVVALGAAGIAIRFHKVSFDRTLFVKMLRFSIPLTLSSLALFIVHFGDRFFLPRYRSLTEVGIYAVAYKLGMLISLVQSSFGTYWASQIYQIVKRDDAQVLFARSLTYMTAALSFCGIGLLVETKAALTILTQPVYHVAASVAPIIILSYFTRSFGDFFRFIFLALGVPMYDAACNWISAGLAITGYILLIPRYGIQGAAWATLITFTVAALVGMVWVYRIWPYQVEVARLSKLGIVGLAIVIAHYTLPEGSLWIMILRGVGLVLAWIIGLLLLRFPTPGEIELARSMAAKIGILRPAPVAN